ncbi:MAG TPA: DUF6156 family protein [Polyangiales bacterium]
MNAETPVETTRYFLTYRGIRLPLALCEELEPSSARHRGTYYRGHYDADGRMVRCEKLVYGEVELLHEYAYDGSGRLCQATVTTAGDEPQTLTFPA